MIIKGRHMEVGAKLHDYAEDKIGKLGKVLDSMIMSAEIELYVEKNPSIENNHVAEVTVFTKGPTIRAKEAATDMFAAIDMVSDKLERQARKLKGKLKDRHSPKAAPQPVALESELAQEAEESEPTIVKTKVVDVKPMTTDEAILQMELLGHDFFVFTSSETEDVNVLYRRRDGDYGLIEPRSP